jgi:NADH-quinone oxidoreductase subunit L
MRALDFLWLIPLLPFISAAVLGLLLRNGQHRSISGIALLGPGASLGVALRAIWEYLQLPPGSVVQQAVYSWAVGPVDLEVAFRLDGLSAVMLFVVTFVGFLIHIFSVGYMGHDAGYRRYFAYLNLFMGAMLLLILGANFLVLFVGWEGVGLCSYLLIGYYFQEEFPPYAAKKAFVVNRIGDFAFLVGLFAIFSTFGTLDFSELEFQILEHPERAASPYVFGFSLASFVTLCLFIGATGKSAQIPLYVWLPDAMAGPTPVSALIHAATMVTAGVYLVVRTNFLYQLAPDVSSLVAGIGALTALFAATIGLAQNDIKKVLAYSTVSQLGYMFLGAGVGAYTAAIFHLGTHAFFKALLFLGAGSVIHALGGEQDLRKMGGLRKALPWTYRTFLVGTLAIAGVPFLSGFFSKDAILAAAWEHSPLLWGIGLLTAILTATYMGRLLFLTFFGEFRGSEEARAHLHESPPVMTIPLSVLAVGSVLAGYAGKIPFTHFDFLGKLVEPEILHVSSAAPQVHHALTEELLLVGASFAAALAGLGVAWRLWGGSRGLSGDDRVASVLGAAYRLIAGKYFVDELYDRLIVRPLTATAKVCHKVIDVLLIDGGIHVAAFATELIGDLGRFTTTGNVRTYALYVVVGIVLLFWWVIL